MKSNNSVYKTKKNKNVKMSKIRIIFKKQTKKIEIKKIMVKKY